MSNLNFVCKTLQGFKALLVDDSKPIWEHDIVKVIDILIINMYFITLLNSLVAFHGTKYGARTFIIALFPFYGGALRVYIVEFSTSNYNLF